MITDRSMAVHRQHLDARRRGHRIYPGAGRRADSRLGLRPLGERARIHRRADRVGQPRPEETNRLLADLRAGKGTLGRLLTDDSAYRELDALIASTRRVTAAVQTGGAASAG